MSSAFPDPAVDDRLAFGLLYYNGTDNLGDEIQSLAARRFLPRIDYLIDRENLASFRPDGEREVVRSILNGWFCHSPDRFEPHPRLEPMLVSLHVTGAAQRRFAEPAVVSFLKRHGPVGTRDLYTLRFLEGLGVPAYFSACLTLTLERPDVPDTGQIVLNDVPPAVVARIRETTTRDIVLTTHVGFPAHSPHLRFERAASLLNVYAGAHAVVTTRLHCAMPCIAMETPVLLLNTAPDGERFDGLHDLVHNASLDEVLSGCARFDPETPPPNPGRHAVFRHDLVRRVTRFVGKDVPPFAEPLARPKRVAPA